MTELGTLYGIGVGPGDPGLVTVRGVEHLSRCPHLVAPKASETVESTALKIVKEYLDPATRIHEVVFPMTTDQEILAERWRRAAEQTAALLRAGEDVSFPTLGDPLLYSTYIYLVRALRQVLPEARIVTVPGVTAFSAAAAATEFAIGEGKSSVTIIPTADDLTAVREALAGEGTVVIMKIGQRLEALLDLLEAHEIMDESVFVSRAGLAGERIETDLHCLRDADDRTGYLSIILTKLPTRESK